jgi:ADP-dependent NAD(P)H-hydrate dehydratase / NAD(P)H-hydrate epimerase
MHELLTPGEMGEADRLTIEAGTLGIDLMRVAGQAVAEAALKFPSVTRGVLVLAGIGNNGGDGFVAAEVLRLRRLPVTVVLIGTRERLRGDAALTFADWQGETSSALPADLSRFGLVIDALFGAGLDRAVHGEAAETIDAVNRSGIPVLAVDLPSGIDGRSGTVRGVAIEATRTVTFFRKKPGHVLFPGRTHCGEIRIAQIGIDDAVLQTLGIRRFENARELWASAYPVPSAEGHKYGRGHAIVVSGGPTRTGAARLAATACLRAGAGLVTVASPGSALLLNAAHLTAIMPARCDDADDLKTLLEDERLNAVVIGPGLGIDDASRNLVLAALESSAALVLDADALTVFKNDPQALFTRIHERRAPVVMTPHSGEFARLFPDLGKNESLSKIDVAERAAVASGATVLLKGGDTVIAEPEGRAAVNTNAPPWLATAGSGDTLAGIIGGLLAQRMPPFEAASAAAWLHGRAGQIAGPGLTADDLDKTLHQAIGALIRDLATTAGPGRTT